MYKGLAIKADSDSGSDTVKQTGWTLVQTANSMYLWPEELHDSNLSIHAHFLDGPQPLCSDHIDFQPCVFSYEQIEVLRRGEVACRQNNIYDKLVTQYLR